ncbi:uncharacterized protein LOC102808290 [Saccoglossus kowalevskii]|uniref:Uncharacterized protein LOC102808290 n=1 Tax=Saccoglossus kowalevskii TaxID=10224 RepID=A0ABM0MW24_SACKO|nr:PREDICTED: uncharacterized protein LOC102808290 [Saccoglossus kowalevskii]
MSDRQHQVASKVSRCTPLVRGLMVTFADAWAVIVLIGPLTIAFWWSTWTIMDVILSSTGKPDTFLISICVGFVVPSLFIPLQSVLIGNIQRRNFAWYTVPRMYVYILSLAVVSLWRGAWGICEFYIGESKLVYVYVGIISYVILWSTRVSYTGVSSPVTLDLDIEIDYYRIKTRFYARGGNFVLRVISIIISVALTAIGGLTWQSVWTLLDHFIYPENELVSFSIFLAIAIILVQLTFTLTPFAIPTLQDIYSVKARILYENLWNVVRLVESILLWRCGWILYDLFDLSNTGIIVLHVFSTLILNVIMCGFTTAASNLNYASLDGEGADGTIFQMPSLAPLVSKDALFKSTRICKCA